MKRSEDPRIVFVAHLLGEMLSKVLDGQPYVLILEMPSGEIDMIANVVDNDHAKLLLAMGNERINEYHGGCALHEGDCNENRGAHDDLKP